MQIKVKLLSVGGIPASDGSIVPREVFESWLNSEEAKNAIASHKLLGACTHISRGKTGLKTNFNPAAGNSIGREDNLLLVGNNTAPTHYIDNIWIDTDQWVWCSATILDEKVMDDEAVQNIKRLRGLLENGVLPGVSAVILGYWDSQQTGTDVLKKLVRMKGFDITLDYGFDVVKYFKLLEPLTGISSSIKRVQRLL